jgi:hypothetical protein
LKQNYPVGKQISVYYDPDNPDLSVLERGAKDLIWIAVAIIATSSLCGLALWSLQRRVRRRLSEDLKLC